MVKTNDPTNKQKIPNASSNKDENMWAMLCHLSGFAGFIIPFGNIIAPLIIWLVKKDEFPLVDDQGKEAVNFQISLTIYIAVCIFLIFIAIGIPLMVVVGIFGVVVMVIAAIKANEGTKYRYPLTIRLIS